MPDLNMRAADPCPTNNAKRAKHSKILKPGCFFVFTPFYQWTNSVLRDGTWLGDLEECDDTEFVTLGGLVVGPKPFGTKGL